MERYEKIKALRLKTGYTKKEFAQYFGIPLRTIEDWEAARRKPPEYLVRLLSYQIRTEKFETTMVKAPKMEKESGSHRNVNVICDTDGNKVVVIHDILFKGKQNICWDDVEIYLKKYVNEFYTVLETEDIIYIGKDLPDEYSSSKYTAKLKGTAAKAKVNAAQVLPELIQISTNRMFTDNYEKKHEKNAKYGWYRFDSRFALAVYGADNEIQRYNVFKARMIIRYAEEGKKYLYDIINIKKETEYPA